MRQLITIFCSVLFLNCTGTAQDHQSLFRNHLPKKVLQDKQLFEQINITLLRDAQLYPELIYHRIEYLHLMFDKEITDQDSNGFNKLRALSSHFYQKKNRWLDYQIEKAKQTNYWGPIIPSVIEDLNSRKVNVTDIFDNEEIIFDVNLMNFYVVKYLNNDPDLIFNKNDDYSELRRIAELEKYNIFLESYNKIQKDTYFDINDQSDDLINHWYIFNSLKQKEFDVYNYMLELNRKLYSQSRFRDNFLFVGGSFLAYDQNYDVGFNVYQFDESVRLTEITDATHLNLMYCRRFVLDNTIQEFSYINIGIHGSLSYGLTYDENYTQTAYKRYDVSGLDYTSAYVKVNDASIDDIFLYGVHLKANTIVFTYGPHITFEAGFMTGISVLSYTKNWDYYYSEVLVRWNESMQTYQNTLLQRFDGTVSEKISKVSFVITPTIDINFLGLNPIIFQFGVGYNFLSVRAGLNF